MPISDSDSGITTSPVETAAYEIWISEQFEILEHGPALIDLPVRLPPAGGGHGGAPGRSPAGPSPAGPWDEFARLMAKRAVLMAAPDAVARAEVAVGADGSSLSFRVLGHALSAARRPDAAERAYRRTLSLDPADAAAWRALGLAHYARGFLGAAVCAFLLAVRCAPSISEFRRNTARGFWAQRHLAEAVDQYGIVLALEPSSGEAWRNRGQVLLTCGDASAALTAFGRAYRLDPSLRDIDYLLGCALNRLGRLEEAAAKLEAALETASPPPLHAAVGLRIVAERLGWSRLAARARAALQATASPPARGGDKDGGASVRHLTPAGFPEFFGELGIVPERRSLPAPPSPPSRFGRDACGSVLNDAAFARSGLFLVRDAELSVWRGAGAFSSYMIAGDRYLATKVYERPNRTATSRVFYFPPDDDYVMPDWLVDMRPARMVELDEPCIYLAGTANYGHFLIDILSKLWVGRVFHVDDSLPVALFPGTGIFREMIDFFFPGRRIIDLDGLSVGVDTLFRLRHATVPSNPSNHFAHAAIRAEVDLRLGPPRRQPWRKVYLSRRNYYPERHRVANESEVAAWLVSCGFEIVEPEKLDFAETIELFRTTRLFVSPCGAQNVNICFSQPGTVYIELGASYHLGESSWFINDCLGCYGDVLYIRHYGETLFVAPGGYDNNWLSHHPIPALRTFFAELGIGEDFRETG